MSILKTLWGFLFRLFPCPTKTGLRTLGNPGPDSPILVTCNFDLSVKRLTHILEGLDVWLLVADSKGVNVWCAAVGEEFNTHSVVSVVKTSGIADKVNHRTLILPPLGAAGVKATEIKAKVEELHELNPMLGHRGVRLAISYPEIYRMQVRAILEAAIVVSKRKKKVLPEIMIPLVGTRREIQFVKREIVQEIEEVFRKKKTRIKYLVGTMIEVPRAAVTADRIASEAEFFSFGTNDLTQMTMGFSRDDAGKFLSDYVRHNIYDTDPFQNFDKKGCGRLVKMGIKLGRQTNPKLKVGICGEHGGDPQSIEFCHQVGMNYVSCSPYRVPVARLAAAHAAMSDKK